MASFSERMGIKPKALQINDIDSDLRNSLWNVSAYIFKGSSDFLEHNSNLHLLARLLYANFFKMPIDDLPSHTYKFTTDIKKRIQNDEWYKVLNMIEFIINNRRISDSYADKINIVMERERSAYRLVNGLFAPITTEMEIATIESAALQSDRFAAVGAHIKRAVELFAQKPAPDYRNTIKEAISAVEAAAKLISEKPKAELNEAIRVIERRHALHPAFKAGIEKFYSYTSDEKGVRHALTENGSNVDEADALFMLVSCSAFSNYLIGRFSQ